MTGFGTWSDKAIRASPTSFSQSGTTMESEGRVIEEFIGAASVYISIIGWAHDYNERNNY
ncbi:hypothetical protein NC651_031525 [Populus alba x Populus x berolinensis]|nr:hypothetical protein NC651_031525 [Populus alba x Populus x berolinensis]